jgi:ActR/RegA family two-component response regulator
MTLTSTSRQITKEPDQFHIAGIRLGIRIFVCHIPGKIGALREYQRLPPSLYQGGITVVSCDLMALNALLMCSDERVLRLLGKALEEVEMEREVCPSAPEALDRTVLQHYSALVLDFDLPGAATVARMARLAPSSRRPVIFGMIGALTEIAETFQAGVNFIIYKPLAFEQIVRCLRAGRGFMRADRRESPRKELESLVYLQFGIAALPAMMLDLNHDGLALQASEPLPPVQRVPVRFGLPGTDNMVEGMGEVIWADDGGRAGVLFSQLTPASRKYLKQWLGKREPKKKGIVRAARSQKVRRAAAGSN